LTLKLTTLFRRSLGNKDDKDSEEELKFEYIDVALFPYEAME